MMESMECIWIIAAAGDVAGDSESANRYLRFVGRMHPLFLHFPIGLALSAAAVELFNIIFRKRSASQFALMATGFATGFAILACISGWLNADFEPSVRYDNTLWLHRWLSIIAAGSLVVVFFCGLIGRTGLRVRLLKPIAGACSCVVFLLSPPRILVGIWCGVKITSARHWPHRLHLLLLPKKTLLITLRSIQKYLLR